MNAASAGKDAKAKLDPKKLLEYIEQLSQLALVTAKIQKFTETLTRCLYSDIKRLDLSYIIFFQYPADPDRSESP